MSDSPCLFCQKLGRLESLAPDERVWSFPHSVALLGPWQYHHGYCILICRTHASELNDLPESERRGYLDEMCLLAAAITQACRPHKLNYELLGNQVPHLHWHLFPRQKDDPDRLSPVWLSLNRAERDEALRDRLQIGPQPRAATVAALQKALTSLGAKNG